MKCDVCGSDNLEGAAYCEDCGAKLVVAAAAAVAVGGGEVHQASPAPVAPAPAPVPMHAPVVGEAQCASCGANNLDTEAYCVDCGASLNPVAPPVAPPAPAMPAAPAAPARVVARLILVSTGKEYRLANEITTLGRRSPADQIEPDIDLTDDDPDSYVSRRHAQVLYRNSQYLYEDVGSSNGSFINNVRAQPGVQMNLTDGDLVRVGKTEFRYQA